MCGLLISIITVVHRGRPVRAPPLPSQYPTPGLPIVRSASLPAFHWPSVARFISLSFRLKSFRPLFSPPLANLWSVYGSSQVARKSREGKEKCLLSTSTSPLFLSNFYCLPVHLPPGVLRHPRSSLAPHHSSTTSFCLAWRPEAFNLHHLPSCRKTARVPQHLPTYFTTSGTYGTRSPQQQVPKKKKRWRSS